MKELVDRKILDEKIKKYFKNDIDFRNRLLERDADAIIEMGIYSNIGFNCEELIEHYENGSIETLYKIAVRKNALRVLYYELIGEEPPEVLKKLLRN